MSNKELIELGDKYLDRKNTKKVKKRAWADTYKIIAIETDRSDITNVLRNYKAMDKKKAKAMFGNIKKDQTSEAIFSIEYLKDILNLLAELDETTGRVKISLGNNIPVSFTTEDEHGRLTIYLAPIIDEELESGYRAACENAGVPKVMR